MPSIYLHSYCISFHKTTGCSRKRVIIGRSGSMVIISSINSHPLNPSVCWWLHNLQYQSKLCAYEEYSQLIRQIFKIIQKIGWYFNNLEHFSIMQKCLNEINLGLWNGRKAGPLDHHIFHNFSFFSIE